MRLAQVSSWGPNAFSALDSLGVGEIARQRAVFTDHITMMDAVNAEEVVRIETGQAFRDHFGGPYAVIHRVDIHASVWEAVLTHRTWNITPPPTSWIFARQKTMSPFSTIAAIVGSAIF
ncbi:salicylate hydroxylase [Escherichia coli]|uniref:Salicylate hydroxylase n=1 Tax=Escherichia coli TaxID=562 RepID=A0A376L7G1_ECOLX|nr:salicylate hydroxylase [Escherichia coli]